MPTNIKHTNETFIAKAKIVHGTRYSYELVEYKNSKSKIKIICKFHGEFEQTPDGHIHQGSGCTSCSNEAKANYAKAVKARVEFVSKANIIHNNKYTYEFVEYINSGIKVYITCKSHGDFLQTPNNHLRRNGCPICASLGSRWTRTAFKDKCIKNNQSKGILYILECFNDKERFIKIGITSLSVKSRYASKIKMPYSYTILHEISGDPEIIYDLEVILHSKSKNYKYTPLTKFGGSINECFKAEATYIDKLNIYINKLNNIQISSNK